MPKKWRQPQKERMIKKNWCDKKNEDHARKEEGPQKKELGRRREATLLNNIPACSSVFSFYGGGLGWSGVLGLMQIKAILGLFLSICGWVLVLTISNTPW